MKRYSLYDIAFIIILGIGGIVLASYDDTLFHNEMWPYFPVILTAYFIGKWVGKRSRTPDR
jgi:hypothetical protein